MIRGAIYLIVTILAFGNFFSEHTSAQTPSILNFDPYEALINEGDKPAASQLQPNDSTLLDYQLSLLDAEGDKLQNTFGFFDEAGNFQAGALGALKLKPSDKKRLIKIANGSLTEREKERIQYDERLLDLLVLLVTPKDQGGGGLTHLRVGDLLRFRNDPRSRETEGTDNISQHQYGKAADIIEINTARCTKKSLLSKKKLPPFPVKVAWQGGVPPNASIATLGAFDAVARANAFRDILGSLPGESYNGAIQGFEDLLQQLQRRVIALDIGLDPSALDFLYGTDALNTLGRAATNQTLGLPPGALTGSSASEMLRSIPRAFLEKALLVPPTSLQGDDWNQALERLGRIVVAYQTNVAPEEVLAGRIEAVAQSPYFQEFRETDAAFRFPSGTYEGIRNNRAEAFRQIGALLIADRLNYSIDESNEFVAQARDGAVQQLSLARYGDIAEFPGNILPMIAPGEGSSKAKGEEYLARYIIDSSTSATLGSLPEEISETLEANTSVFRSLNSRRAIIQFLAGEREDKLQRVYRQVGARFMENVFNLPNESLSEAMRRHGDPTLDQFLSILERQLATDRTQERQSGKDYFETTFREAFQEFYHMAEAGPTRLSSEDIYAILIGKVTDASTRAGASWVEEDLGLTPDSFSVLFTQNTPEERLVHAGLTAVGGELFDAFEISQQSVTNGEQFKLAIGQARIETILGIKPGSFRDSIKTIEDENKVRYGAIFGDSNTVDIILGLPSGTTDQLKNGQTKPSDIALQVGSRDLDRLNTEDLQERLGWDSQYKIDGERLLRTIRSSDGTTKGVSDGKTYTMRGILAQIGSYSADFAFGYEPGTIERWIHAPANGTQNAILMEQGAKLYADRLGLDPRNRDDMLESYKSGKADAKRRVTEALKTKLEGAKEDIQEEILESAKDTVRSELVGIEDELSRREPKNSAERAALNFAKRQVAKAKDKIDQTDRATSARRNRDSVKNKVTAPPPPVSTEELLRSVKEDVRTVIREIDNQSGQTNPQLFAATKEQLGVLDQRIDTEVTKWQQQQKLPAVKINIPAEDLQSFVNGHMKLAQGVIVAARQAKQTYIDIEDTYELLRIMTTGWGSDPELEKQLFTEIRDRYSAQLEEYAIVQGFKEFGDALDRADILPYADFERLTKGVLKPDGQFSANETPYKGQSVERVKLGFFSNKEAKNNLYYGALDYQMRKNDPALPKDFSKTIMEGSNKDRAKMLYTFLGTKVDATFIAQLPPDVQGKAREYLRNYDPQLGKVYNPNYDPDKEISSENRQFLEQSDVYNDWANSILTLTFRKGDGALPAEIGGKSSGEIIRRGSESERLMLSFQFLKAKAGDNIIASLPPELRAKGTLYLDNFDPTVGRVKNPDYDSRRPESSTNTRYLPVESEKIIKEWAQSTFNSYVHRFAPSLPNNAGDIILKGSELDRKKLAFAVVSTQAAQPIISALPSDLQSLASEYLKNFDVAKGKVLASNDIFTTWAGDMISKYIGAKIPSEVIKLASIYLTEGKVGLSLYLIREGVKLGEQLDARIKAFITLGKEKLIVWVGKQLGLPVEQMQAYYDKYKQAQSLYRAYKAGKIDVAEAVLAVDQLLLDGKISRFVGKIDEALGLPAGSSQSLIMFAITGNPIYALQFAYTLFFGFTIKCPNLQQEAQKNVKKLIAAVLDIGYYDRRLVPSQIIAYDQSYVAELLGRIKQNYQHCFEIEEARCGVFARSEYARQVHIGF